VNLHLYIVQIRKGTKRITLQRFLCSKIAYGQDFSEVELAALYHNQLWLQTKCLTDVDFKNRFGSDLELLTQLLKKANFSRGLTEGTVRTVRKAMLAEPWDFLYPQRNLPQIEFQLQNSIITKWRRPEGVLTKTLPPEKHIGKGYRDHGTAQRPHLDASPSWQEVGSEVGRLQGLIERKKDAITEERIEQDPIGVLEDAEEILNLIARVETISNRGSSNPAKATKK